MSRQTITHHRRNSLVMMVAREVLSQRSPVENRENVSRTNEIRALGTPSTCLGRMMVPFVVGPCSCCWPSEVIRVFQARIGVAALVLVVVLRAGRGNVCFTQRPNGGRCGCRSGDPGNSPSHRQAWE